MTIALRISLLVIAFLTHNSMAQMPWATGRISEMTGRMSGKTVHTGQMSDISVCLKNHIY